ncbi:MAG TPA: OmpH family outer membrane protein [Isosphaeraceae bacterium]|nr:OmpH family outer membrane protein [Isosphaeraceae bacterium]
MSKRRRAAWTCGVGLTLLSGVMLVARTSGQDNAVQKTSGQSANRSLIAVARIGCVDMEAVFKGYKKVEFLKDEIEVEAKAKQAELTKLMSDAQQVAKEMESFQPGSEDFKKHDAKMSEYRIRLDSEREQAQKEFAAKEAEALATIYKEIEAVVKQVAEYNQMNYVVRVSNEPVSGSDPNSVMAAMSRAVVYSDPSMDITNVVVSSLNARYQAQNPAAAARPAAAPAARPATAPAANPAAAPRGR